MNINDNNIDKLFRDAANDAYSPDFKESYWNEMRSILNQQKKSKIVLALEIIWTILALSGLSIVFAILFLQPIANEKDLSLADTKSIGFKNDKQTSVQIKTNDEVLDKTVSKTSNVSSSNSAAEIASLAETNLNSKAHKFSDLELSEKDISQTYGDINNKKQDQDLKNKSRGESINDEVNKISSTTFYLQMKNEDITNLDQNRNVLITNSLSPRKVKPLSEIKTNEELIHLLPRRIKAEHGFNIDLGLSFVEPYQGNTSSSNRFSIAGMYSLDYNNILLRTGVGLTIERSSNLSVREESTIYGYTATKYENILDYKMFTEAYLPLEVGYRFNNTTFGAGGQLNILLGTRMSHIEKVNNEVVNSRILNNRMEGLNPITGGAYLWIQQHLNTRLMAGVRIGRNIGSRIEGDIYLNDVSKPTPVFGQIYISYQLFRK